jgi:hypothetical protein
VRALPRQYDAARVGDTVSLHYLRASPRTTVGMAERKTVDLLRDLRARLGERNGIWLLWIVGGAVLMLFARIFVGVAVLLVSLARLVSSGTAIDSTSGLRPSRQRSSAC